MPADYRRIRNLRIGTTKDWNDQRVTNVKDITIGNVTDEDGFLKIYGKDIDTLSLGDSSHEGGDISIYRDASNNKQLYVNADAASNVIAMSIYGGVVAQNYLTVGSATLSTTYPFYNAGYSYFGAETFLNAPLKFLLTDDGVTTNDNVGTLPLNIAVAGTDNTTHKIELQIDRNDIIIAQATGAGGGGIITQTSKLVELHAYLTSWIGTTGGFNLRITEATGTATAANTFDIEVNIPSGARILGTQLRVDTALSSSNGGVSWAAAYIDGSTSAITTGAAFTQNTKANTMYNANGANDIASAETDIRVTCDSGKLFVADGQVKAIVYYQDFTAMANV